MAEKYKMDNDLLNKKRIGKEYVDMNKVKTVSLNAFIDKSKSSWLRLDQGSAICIIDWDLKELEVISKGRTLISTSNGFVVFDKGGKAKFRFNGRHPRMVVAVQRAISFHEKDKPFEIRLGKNPLDSLIKEGRRIAMRTDYLLYSGKSDPKEVISAIIDIIPFAGTLKGIIDLIGGKDSITGKPLDRWATAANILLGVIPVTKIGSTVSRKVLKKAPKIHVTPDIEKALLTNQNQALNQAFSSVYHLDKFGMFDTIMKAKRLSDFASIRGLEDIAIYWNRAKSHVVANQIKRLQRTRYAFVKTEGAFVNMLRRSTYAHKIFDGDGVYDKVRNKFWDMIKKDKRHVFENAGFYWKGIERAPRMKDELIAHIYSNPNFRSTKVNGYVLTIDHVIERQSGAVGKNFVDADRLTFMPMKTNRGKGQVTRAELAADIGRRIRRAR